MNKISFKIFLSKMLLGIFLISINTSVFAQIGIGIKAGPQVVGVGFSQSETKSNYDKKLKLGFQIGAVTNFYINDKVTLVMELNYSMKGRNVQIKEANMENNATYHFIDYPVLFRYSKEFQDRTLGKFIGYFNIGPNFSYWLGGNGTLKGGELENIGDSELEYDIEFSSNKNVFGVMYIEEPNRIQVGIDLGVGMIFDLLDDKTITVDFRYSWGHTNYGEIDGAVTKLLTFQDDLRFSNQIFAISAIYMWNINLNSKNKGKSVSNSKENVGRKLPKVVKKRKLK